MNAKGDTAYWMLQIKSLYTYAKKGTGMECNMDSDLLQEYADGTLTGIERKIIEEHLKFCKSCSREVNEIKLFTFELDGLFKEDVDIPQKIEGIREGIIEKACSTGERYTVKKFMTIQKQALRESLNYTNYIPGADIIKKVVKKAPALLMKAAGNMLISGVRLAKARGRA